MRFFSLFYCVTDFSHVLIVAQAPQARLHGRGNKQNKRRYQRSTPNFVFGFGAECGEISTFGAHSVSAKANVLHSANLRFRRDAIPTSVNRLFTIFPFFLLIIFILIFLNSLVL